MQSTSELLQRMLATHAQRLQLEQQERQLLQTLIEQQGITVLFLAPMGEGQWTATLGVRQANAVTPDAFSPGLRVGDHAEPVPAPVLEPVALAVETGPLARVPALPTERHGERRQGEASVVPTPLAPPAQGLAPDPVPAVVAPDPAPQTVLPSVAQRVADREEAAHLAMVSVPDAPVRQVASSIDELRAMGTTGGLRVVHRGTPRANPLRQQSGDKRARAIRMARTFASDIIAYRPEDHRQAVADGVAALAERFAADIQKAKGRFEEQVSLADVPDREMIFRDAINELLGKGQAVIPA